MIETFIRRAAAAVGAGVPEEEVEEIFIKEGCPPESARIYVIAGRQLAMDQDGGQERSEKGITPVFSTAQAEAIGDLLDVDWSKVDLEQFRIGLGVEMEHSDITGGDPLKTGKIVLAHLKEKRDYYDRLVGAGLEAGERSSKSINQSEGECHVCQPFTQIVRDEERFKKCMALAEQIGEINNSKAAYRLIRGDLGRQDQEVFVLVCVDFRGKLRHYALIGKGQRHRVAVDVDDVITPVLLSKCDGFYVAHAHPSGIAEPSDADGDLTEAIKKAAAVACPNVHFLDHLVIGGGGEGGDGQWYSFADNGWKVDGKVHKA